MLQIDDRRFNRLAASAVGIGFLLLFLAFVGGIFALIGTERSSEQVDHSYEVVDQLAEIEVRIERAEAASRGYLLSPAPVRLSTFRENVAEIPPGIDRLALLTIDNAFQQRNVAKLRTQVADELDTLTAIMAKAGAGQSEAARADFVREVQLRRVNAIRSTTGAMRTEELRLLDNRIASQSRSSSLSKLVLGLTGLLLILIGIGATWLVRRYTRDLTQARDRLHLLNTDLEGAVAERTADLTLANDEIQRFAYIVSHDLRSPLVNIMGFTSELERADKMVTNFFDTLAKSDTPVPEDVRLAVHEDLPESIDFIRSSTQKMDRLIQAILSLSRQGRRVLTPEHLPMDTIVGEVVRSLEMVAADRNARFLIEAPLPDLFHDRLTVEQIFTNLMENAVKYLAPGRPGVINIRGTANGGRTRFEVEDNGRGIAPEDHSRVFDLFRRSGQQDQQGEGIGLANVRSLAYRLGGTVTLRSVLSEGSTFIVELPQKSSAEGKPE
ncbi:MAG: ATP-binding protein [Pseudomonadota bacterium]